MTSTGLGQRVPIKPTRSPIFWGQSGKPQLKINRAESRRAVDIAEVVCRFGPHQFKTTRITLEDEQVIEPAGHGSSHREAQVRDSVVGELDSSLPAQLREQAGPRPSRLPACLELSGITSISGQGLRMLLLLCRQVCALGGTISANGASRELVGSQMRRVRRLASRDHWHGDRLADFRPVRQHIDAYPTHLVHGYSIRIGPPYPMGAASMEGGINFAIYFRHAKV